MFLKTVAEIRQDRLSTAMVSHDVILAPLWPKTGDNLGTLLRTADAIRGCMATVSSAPGPKAIHRGDRIGVHNVCIHWIDDPIGWLTECQGQGYVLMAVELAHGSVTLGEVHVEGPVVILLGHESRCIPEAALSMADVRVEIPMMGVGDSLNVAVAGSLVAYKVRGWV